MVCCGAGVAEFEDLGSPRTERQMLVAMVKRWVLMKQLTDLWCKSWGFKGTAAAFQTLCLTSSLHLPRLPLDAAQSQTQMRS